MTKKRTGKKKKGKNKKIENLSPGEYEELAKLTKMLGEREGLKYSLKLRLTNEMIDEAKEKGRKRKANKLQKKANELKKKMGKNRLSEEEKKAMDRIEEYPAFFEDLKELVGAEMTEEMKEKADKSVEETKKALEEMKED